MLRITRKSSKPCLVCQKVNKNVEISGDDVRGSMCLDHAYERLDGEKVKEKERPKDTNTPTLSGR